jgi:hypothetical protein
VRVSTDVPGCRFRPLPATETVDETGDVVVDPWKATCPPVPAVLAAKANDEVVADVRVYGSLLTLVRRSGGVRKWCIFSLVELDTTSELCETWCAILGLNQYTGFASLGSLISANSVLSALTSISVTE